MNQFWNLITSNLQVVTILAIILFAILAGVLKLSRAQAPKRRSKKAQRLQQDEDIRTGRGSIPVDAASNPIDSEQ